MLNPGHNLQLKKLKEEVLDLFPGATFKLLPRRNRAWTSTSENSPSENTPGENTREDSPSENTHHASIQELERKLTTIKTIEELKGFANRRSIFKLDVPKWNENEKRAIQWRKIELEKNNK